MATTNQEVHQAQALGDNAARQLANATKTVPQLSTISPRWLVLHSFPKQSEIEATWRE